MDEIQTWWEIPSIVHFCKVFTHITKDISLIDINEFENAIEENSYLLTDMAIRFTKICGFYDPSTDEWWNVMKKKFKNKCILYNFKYSLDSATHFDYLTRKQKVEALYIYCHLVLDVKHIQNKISNKPKMWHMLNVKPLGFDLNKSVYWYFGSNKLYREDFENVHNLSTNLSVEHNLHKTIPHEPFPSGVFGSGKWNTICDNIDNWYSLADITQYSNNINIRCLHKAICNIITNLPKVKRKKSYYVYMKPNKPLRSTFTRTLRSMNVMEVEHKKLNTNSSVNEHKQYSQNIMENQTKNMYESSISQRNISRINLNVHHQNQNISHPIKVFKNDVGQIEKCYNKTPLKLQLKSGNVNVINKCVNKITELDQVLHVNIERFDQENTHHYNNLKRKLRSSKNITKTPPFKDLLL
ncbi:cat eye syndrome critical region protein 2-like [Melanaphis sacchari]|uniref:cat eye syndrome critical region protein 2-like n=1 Tax=Melanaphis sacchari TaxID=742174 RepID=UPI000DC15213|nr:cat eye syndrome critical region protein 2-like [Melanaphis sacchari]